MVSGMEMRCQQVKFHGVVVGDGDEIIDSHRPEHHEDDENETTAPLNSGEVKCLILVVTAV